jgi:hypothetical protein
MMTVRILIRKLGSLYYRLFFMYQAYPVKILMSEKLKIFGHIKVRGSSGTIIMGKRMLLRGATFIFSDGYPSVLTFGDDVILDEHIIISPRKGSITIGSTVFIGPFSII